MRMLIGGRRRPSLTHAPTDGNGARGMSSPEAVAEGVKGSSRFIYFGINPGVGAYVSPSNYGGHSNLDPWPMYVLKQHASQQEDAGTAYFLTIQVSDGTPLPVDRNANRLANNLARASSCQPGRMM